MQVWTLLAIASVAGSVLLGWPTSRGLTRLQPEPEWERPRWLRGRAGASGRRRRVISGGIAGVAAFVLLGSSAVAAAVAVVVAAVAVVGLGLLSEGAEARRRERVALALPGGLELLAAALEAGTPISAATATVAAAVPDDLRAELELICARVNIGESESMAWRLSRDRAVIGPVARDVARATESGAALASCLRRHADAARRERRARLEARAKAVGVRGVVPMAVCFLPAFIAIGVVPIVAGIAAVVIPK